LQRALNHTDLPETPAYVEAARKEARRTGFVMSDFVGEDDKLRTTPVAVGWKIGLEQLAAKRDQLKTLETDIATKLKPECRTAPTNALAQARALLGTVDEPDDVEGISAAVTDAQAAYNVAWDNRDCRIAALADATREAPVESVEVSAPGAEEAAPPTFDLHGGLLRAETALGWAGVVLAAAFVLVLAGTTVYEAAYESKPAFAGFADYFALFSAALASSAATTVLGLLAYWRPAPATPA
jgi:hypothetical protein